MSGQGVRSKQYFFPVLVVFLLFLSFTWAHLSEPPSDPPSSATTARDAVSAPSRPIQSATGSGAAERPSCFGPEDCKKHLNYIPDDPANAADPAALDAHRSFYKNFDFTDDEKHGLYLSMNDYDLIDAADRPLLRAGALRVLADEKRCKRIDQGWKSARKPKPFNVVCHGIGGALFNVSFDEADLRSPVPLKNPDTYDEEASRRLCEAEIKNSVRHPSTVDIHWFLGYHSESLGNGDRYTTLDFTAQNDFGLKLVFRAECVVKPDGKLSIDIAEKK